MSISAALTKRNRSLFWFIACFRNSTTPYAIPNSSQNVLDRQNLYPAFIKISESFNFAQFFKLGKKVLG
ncbi:hypothetical protein C7B76_05305 [filamentous cyanobacterium CCP2]|nr:hypothetical protein C7B76_05305 [filamentous cyanobacterium CCP2]